MTKDEALKLALEALEDLGMKHFESTGEVLYKDTFTAIKEAFAQPEHGWTPERIAGIARLKDAQDKKLAQRTWAGLTDEEIQYCVELKNPEAIAEEVEAKLKEKNT